MPKPSHCGDRVWNILDGVSTPKPVEPKLALGSPSASIHPLSMEEEQEVLDWGNEDDEQQQAFCNDSAAGGLAARQGDLDDAEDSVSLGEEEDYQDYYAQPSPAFNADIAGKNSIPAASPRRTVSSASPYQHPAQAMEGLSREDSAASQNSPKQSIGSPLTKEKSTSQRSPHRSRSFSTTTRLTHALPPKPVAISVPFLHPSHPSIVEATAMSTRPQGRSESNKSKVNGNTAPTVTRAGSGGKRSSSVGAVEADSLPPNWEVRHPRNGGGVYFYNSETSQSTWTRPVSGSDTTHPFRESRGDHERRRRSSNVSAGDSSLSQLRSDNPQYQEHSRPRRGQPASEVSIPDASQSAPSLGGLSYEDRHYRPGEPENNNTSVVERSRGDRIREDYQEARYNSRPDVGFTPPHSPPQFRRRERSLSPSLPTSVSRGRDSRPHRSMRRRGDHTDADLSMQRDRDQSQVAPVPRQHWSQGFDSPAEHHDHQGSRRQQRQTTYEPSAASEGRSSLRNGNGRVRHRDGDHSRVVEPDEGSRNHDQNTSAPSTLSASSSHPPYLHLSYADAAMVALALLWERAKWFFTALQIESLVDVTHCVSLLRPFPTLITPGPSSFSYSTQGRSLIMDFVFFPSLLFLSSRVPRFFFFP